MSTPRPEYPEQNERPVLALREGTWLRVADGNAEIGGAAVNAQYGPAHYFSRDSAPREISGSVDWLFQS